MLSSLIGLYRLQQYFLSLRSLLVSALTALENLMSVPTHGALAIPVDDTFRAAPCHGMRDASKLNGGSEPWEWEVVESLAGCKM